VNAPAPVSDQAGQILQELRELIEKGGQFVMEQAPPLAREIVWYGRVVESLELAIALVLAVFSVRYFQRRMSRDVLFIQELDVDAAIEHGVSRILWVCLRVLVGVLSSIDFCFQIRPCILAWVAPRLYLLEYLLTRIRQ
jgi:hypothetical protein